MEIRFAKKEELEEVNKIRKQVSDLHSKGRPDIFYPEFKGEIVSCIYDIYEDETKKIIVALEKDQICGMAIIQEIHKTAGVYQKARDYIEVDQFGVKNTFRRQGVATKLIDFIKEYARAQGFPKLELNMWEFNQDALAFYETVGFSTYRRYMELDVTQFGFTSNNNNINLDNIESLRKIGYRRFLFKNNYVALYLVEDDENKKEVTIMHIFYAKRDYEKLV